MYVWVLPAVFLKFPNIDKGAKADRIEIQVLHAKRRFVLTSE